MEIHPEFFPDTRKWVAQIDGRRVEASSLREMQARLGPDVKIIGYAPDGFPVSAADRGYNIDDLRSADIAQHARPVCRTAPKVALPEPGGVADGLRQRRGGRPRGETFRRVAALLGTGMRQGEVARELGISRARVSQIAAQTRGRSQEAQ